MPRSARCIAVFSIAVLLLTSGLTCQASAPEPAAAATKTVPPVEEMAFFWSSVQLLVMLVFTSLHFFKCFFVGHRSNFFEIIFFIATNRMIFAKFA